MYVVEILMQNAKDFNIRPKYSDSVENATDHRDEYQEVASGMWGCGGAKISTR
jgi:hypothetical protein